MDTSDDKEKPVCPACLSTDTRLIPENERMASVGLFAIHQFIGQLYQDETHECNRCLYRFSLPK